MRKWELIGLCEDLKAQIINAERRRRQMKQLVSVYESRVKTTFAELVKAREELTDGGDDAGGESCVSPLSVNQISNHVQQAATSPSGCSYSSAWRTVGLFVSL